MTETDLKVIGTAVISTISAALGILYVPVMLMVLCNCIDFGTGIAASMKKGEKLTSEKIMWGITKKVGMWILVIIGAVVDKLIAYAASTTGIKPPMGEGEPKTALLVACVVAVWIVCSELISILENLIDIGVAMPPFLMPIIKVIQRQAEEIGAVREEDEHGTDQGDHVEPSELREDEGNE